ADSVVTQCWTAMSLSAMGAGDVHVPPQRIPRPISAPPARILGRPGGSRVAGVSPAPRDAPRPHPSGVRPPEIPAKFMPQHVAVVMDGNGRWAAQRGLPRTRGHEAGEAALLDMVHGAIEAGISCLSAYAFSTENWK